MRRAISLTRPGMGRPDTFVLECGRDGAALLSSIAITEHTLRGRDTRTVAGLIREGLDDLRQADPERLARLYGHGTVGAVTAWLGVMETWCRTHPGMTVTFSGDPHPWVASHPHTGHDGDCQPRNQAKGRQ